MGWEWLVSPAVAAAIAITGWAITWRKARSLEKDTLEKSLRESARRDKDLENIREQLDALKRQADALQKQADIEEAQSLIPRWDLTQVENLLYAVKNGNAFKACGVRIEFEFDPSGETKRYDLGDLEPGSSTTFLFMEMGIWGAPNQVRIVWHTDAFEEERSVGVPVRYSH